MFKYYLDEIRLQEVNVLLDGKESRWADELMDWWIG
jgi:hypothetical protein